MTDLTYSYIHMTRRDLLILDTIETKDYISGVLEGEDFYIPDHFIPPNPDEADSPPLPSEVHPSYPYGNPNSQKHPSSRPRRVYNFSRALFEDMGHGGAINGNLRWTDLALFDLLPVDEEKEGAIKAINARKLASGSSNNNPQAQQAQQPQQTGQNDEEEDEEDEDEDEDDENDDSAEIGDDDDEDDVENSDDVYE